MTQVSLSLILSYSKSWNSKSSSSRAFAGLWTTNWSLHFFLNCLLNRNFLLNRCLLNRWTTVVLKIIGQIVVKEFCVESTWKSISWLRRCCRGWRQWRCRLMRCEKEELLVRGEFHVVESSGCRGQHQSTPTSQGWRRRLLFRLWHFHGGPCKHSKSIHWIEP